MDSRLRGNDTGENALVPSLMPRAGFPPAREWRRRERPRDAGNVPASSL